MKEFPILENITYLDTAASAQKPLRVIEAVSDYYKHHHANVHRGIHKLADAATKAYEDARKIVALFLNATPDEIIFTKGTTESLNLVASSYELNEGDTVVLTELEHHSNLVPWQQAAKRANCTLKYIPVLNGQLDYAKARKIIEEGCSVLAVSHLSNVTGSVQDVKKLAKLVHEQNGIIVVDGAQSAPHMDIDVKELDVDFFAFSGHKLYGPTGIGVLYGKRTRLRLLDPYQYGGEMISEVSREDSTWAQLPQKFEAGTPPIAQAVGLSEAIKWFQEQTEKRAQEEEVVLYADEQLRKMKQVEVHSCFAPRALVTFSLKGIHPHDVAQFLDDENIAIRAGHHCTQVLHKCFDLTATCRASFGLYNTKKDVDKLIKALKKCSEAFIVP